MLHAEQQLSINVALAASVAFSKDTVHFLVPLYKGENPEYLHETLFYTRVDTSSQLKTVEEVIPEADGKRWKSRMQQMDFFMTSIEKNNLKSDTLPITEWTKEIYDVESKPIGFVTRKWMNDYFYTAADFSDTLNYYYRKRDTVYHFPYEFSMPEVREMVVYDLQRDGTPEVFIFSLGRAPLGALATLDVISIRP